MGYWEFQDIQMGYLGDCKFWRNYGSYVNKINGLRARLDIFAPHALMIVYDAEKGKQCLSVPYSNIISIRKAEQDVYYIYFKSLDGKGNDMVVLKWDNVTYRENNDKKVISLNARLTNPYPGDVTAYREANKDEQEIEKKENQRTKTALFIGYAVVAAIIAVILFLAIGGGSLLGSSGSSVNKATCDVCGKSWSAGDSGGNYKSIARTHMCVNCYSNYKYASDVLSGN